MCIRVGAGAVAARTDIALVGMCGCFCISRAQDVEAADGRGGTIDTWRILRPDRYSLTMEGNVPRP